MKVTLIEAKTAKELTDQLNNFLGHVKNEYKDDPYVEIMRPVEFAGYLWRAFVFFKEDMKQ